MKPLRLIFLCLCCSWAIAAQARTSSPQQRVDSLYQVLRKEPGKFCDLVSWFSEDLASKDLCGFYDYEAADNFVTPVAELVLRAKDYSRVYPPVKSIYGYHIVQPLGVKGKEISFRHLFISTEN